ncbi:hypothetical protein ACP70R_005540 [Stipagrostis hirtigluma subsp. patula]
MASMTSLPLQYLLLFLLLAQLIDSAVIPRSKNNVQQKPQPWNTYIVHANHLARPSHFATLEHWYTSMVATNSPGAATNTSRILYTYDTVMHGFAVQLTGAEAQRMANAPGVAGVYEDRMLHPQTTRSPGFLGLDPGFGAWPDTDFGDGVIIGFVDTGIWPESASFNDSGLGPVRPSWKGKCVDAADFSAAMCNNKLVGAKAFIALVDNPSPRDDMEHGTHVASTAAGSEVRGVSDELTFVRGTARGVASKAKVAMYKAGVKGNSPSADVVAAIDAAVKDGVDIISMSLGFDATAFHNDTVAIAVFGAVRKGVFVVLSAGNYGPAASSLHNVAPWMTTVGASTVDRVFPSDLMLGDGVVLTGQSLYAMKANGTAMIPLVSSSCSLGDLTPEKVMGKIVVCMDGAGVAAETLVQNAGGAGLVVVDSSIWFRGGMGAIGFTLPGLVLSHTGGEKLRAYLASATNPKASFRFACEAVVDENRAPMVVDFSSRGPNPVVPEILKPDVIAPGRNILAAMKDKYGLKSGTSMSCPHVAGVAALIKKRHPNWTPAMIRSALVTTAGTLHNTDREILDNAVFKGRGVTAATPFAAGAGHVRPQLAMDPGLVYDAGAQDYIDFLCALNYTTEQLRRFAPDLATCTRTPLSGGPAGLNYPSFVVVFDGRADVRTLTRTVTKVSEKAETYKVTVVAPEQVKVTVRPTTLEFKEQNERKNYTVDFRTSGNPKAGWEFGHIIWENDKHQVRSPVAFMWKK